MKGLSKILLLALTNLSPINLWPHVCVGVCVCGCVWGCVGVCVCVCVFNKKFIFPSLLFYELLSPTD